MQKLNARFVAKLEWGNCRGPNDLAPFGGKYPTRLLYRIKYVGKPTIEYIGKPSTSAVSKMLKLYKRRDFETFYAAEFDRKQLVATGVPDVRGTYPYQRAGYSFVFYHPHGNGRAFMSDIGFVQHARLAPHQYVSYKIKVADPYKYHYYSIEVLVRPAAAPEPPALAVGIPHPLEPEAGNDGRFAQRQMLNDLMQQVVPQQPELRGRNFWHDLVAPAVAVPAPPPPLPAPEAANRQQRRLAELQRLKVARNARRARLGLPPIV